MVITPTSSKYFLLGNHTTMSNQRIIDRLNTHKPGFLTLLGGEITDFDSDKKICTFTFYVPFDFCHTGDVVQGGFVTAMLDAAMAHAIFGSDPSVARLSSLEISTRYENATRGQTPLTVKGWVTKATKSIAFMSGEIRAADGQLCASAQSVAKISRKD